MLDHWFHGSSFQWRVGCGSGSHTHLWKFMRLPSVLWSSFPLFENETKRAGSAFTPPAHAISTKNKHLLVIYTIPTRGFMAVVSVFMGTPPAKPLDCKIRVNTTGALVLGRWAHPTGGEPRFPRAKLRFVSADIIEMSRLFRSLFVHLSLLPSFAHSLTHAFIRLPPVRRARSHSVARSVNHSVILGKQKTLLTSR